MHIPPPSPRLLVLKPNARPDGLCVLHRLPLLLERQSLGSDHLIRVSPQARKQKGKQKENTANHDGDTIRQ